MGYASSTACQLTSEISAHWLSQHFRGELALPPIGEMHELLRVEAWRQQALPARCEGYFVGPYLAQHVGDLMADMGLRTRRTSNFVTEYLRPFSPARYRALADERRLSHSRAVADVVGSS